MSKRPPELALEACQAIVLAAYPGAEMVEKHDRFYLRLDGKNLAAGPSLLHTWRVAALRVPAHG